MQVSDVRLPFLFDIAKLGIIDNVLIPGIAYRRTEVKDSSIYALAVWAQKAKLIASTMSIEAINVARLKEIIPTIRSMTLKSPEEFCPNLVKALAECGIALVLLPHMKGTFLHGATFYDGRKIVMGLTLRGRDADRFWFSLFHEIAHIELGHIGRSYALSQEEEKEADQYAADILIPPKNYEEFTSRGSFTEASIKQFSKAIEIDPGIVVGRLQKDRYIDFSWLKSLKTQYVFAE